MTDWHAQIRTDMNFAKTMLLQQGHVQTMFVVHSPTATTVIGASWADDQQKRIVQRLVALEAAIVDADAICMIAEAWMDNVKKRPGESQRDALKRAARPSTSDSRVEVVIVSIAYRDRGGVNVALATSEIIRDDAGDVVDVVAEDEIMSGVAVEGALQRMLLPRLLTEIERDVAIRARDVIKEMTGVFTAPAAFVHPAGHA
jgi:hypothetical protein